VEKKGEGEKGGGTFKSGKQSIKEPAML